MKKENYSVSRLALYDTCKFSYYLKYVKKIKIPWASNKWSEFGQIVHWAAENNVFDIDRIRKKIIDTPKEYSQISEKDLGKELDKNIANLKAYKESEKDWEIVEEEGWINHYGKTFDLVGKIDRMLIDKDCIKIVDYKTTSKVKDCSDQLKLYHLMALLNGHADKKIITELFFTRLNQTVTKEYSKKEIAEFIALIKAKINKIESTTVWTPASDYGNCMFCDYKDKPEHCRHSCFKGTRQSLPF